MDGVILIGTQHEGFVHNLLSFPVQTVLVDPKVLVERCSQVLIDNETGAFTATEHLIQAGHRRIGFISGDISRRSFRQRLDGYLKALRYHKIPEDKITYDTVILWKPVMN